MLYALLPDFQCLTCHKSDIYILFKDNSIRTLSLMPVTKYLLKLHEKPTLPLLHSVFINHSAWVLKTSSKRNEMLQIASDLEECLNSTNQEQDTTLARIKSKLQQKLSEAQDNEELRKTRSDSSTSSGTEPPTGFSRLDTGMYVMKVRSVSAGSDDLHDEHDAILERVLAREKSKSEDTKSVDTMSISSNTSDTDPGKVEAKLIGAKTKLLGIKNKLRDKISRRKSDTDTGGSNVETGKMSGLKRDMSEPSMAHNINIDPVLDKADEENLESVKEEENKGSGSQQSAVRNNADPKIKTLMTEKGVPVGEPSSIATDKDVHLPQSTENEDSTGQGEAVDSSYESDIQSEKRSASSDTVSHSEQKDVHHSKELQTSRSSESLLSMEAKEGEDCGKESGSSRRGSFTSNDISLSSNELVFGPPVIGKIVSSSFLFVL